MELRMYGLVLYNISPIQQGIQFGHAVVEHQLKYDNGKCHTSSLYKEWARHHKTFIILNGGTSNSSASNQYGMLQGKGTMEVHLETLKINDIKVTPFYEPDLNNALSAMVFLVDERVFNREKYPDFVEPEGLDILQRTSLMEEWVKNLGGSSNVFLRSFLKQFRLA